MFYQLDDEITGIDLNEINDSTLTIGYISVEELEEVYRRFDFSMQTVERCKEKYGFLSCTVEIYDDYSFVRINDINAKKGLEKNCLALYIKKNLVLIVNIKENEFSNRDIFMKLLSRISNQNTSLEKIVCFFFDELINGDSRHLDDAQLEINRLEEDVITSKAENNFNIHLLSMKKELLLLRGYYEQLIDIGEILSENENDIFDGSNIKSFRIFVEKAIRLKENADLLRDSVVHLWDAYQAYLEMRLNESMKVFTLMTTIFFPLTLIVGWYGMNFQSMPELEWKYGYVFVILLSVSVVTILWIWFKKKKWI